MKIVDPEIKAALVKKGYTWDEISIQSRWYPYLFEVKLDGKLVEYYDSRKQSFID